MSWRSRVVRPSDVALTVAFVAFALVEEYVVRLPGDWWPFVLAGSAMLVLLRRLMPLVVLLVNSIAGLRVFYPPDIISYRLWQLFAIIIAAFTIGQLVPIGEGGWRARARGLLGGLLVLFAALVYWDNDPSDPMAAFFFTVGPYGLGLVVAMQARRMAEAAAARAAVREQVAREAVTEERVRIARELHDVVAHSVTVMVIQAGVVRRRLEAGLEVDPELLRLVESSGREAVEELRRTLALLRGGESDAALPPVGLERLDELVTQLRDAGVRVTVDRRGQPRPLRPAMDVSAYRIVQEALTNVLKHAGPARVVVELEYGSDELRLSIVDDGGRPAPGANAATGRHGLIGMRERVMAFGGDITASPRPEGGFAVRARLPLPADGTRLAAPSELSPLNELARPTEVTG